MTNLFTNKILLLLIIIFIILFIIINLNKTLEHGIFDGLFAPKPPGKCSVATDCPGWNTEKIVCCKSGGNVPIFPAYQGTCTTPIINKGIGWCPEAAPTQGKIGDKCSVATDCQGWDTEKTVCCKNKYDVGILPAYQGVCTKPTISKGIGWCPNTAKEQKIFSDEYIIKNKLCTIGMDCNQFGKNLVCCTPDNKTDVDIMNKYGGKCVKPCMSLGIGWCPGTAKNRDIICDGTVNPHDLILKNTISKIDKNIDTLSNTLSQWNKNIKNTEIKFNNLINNIDIKPIEF